MLFTSVLNCCFVVLANEVFQRSKKKISYKDICDNCIFLLLLFNIKIPFHKIIASELQNMFLINTVYEYNLFF